MKIRVYSENDKDAVIALWQTCSLTRPWNDPEKDIQRKLTCQPELFLVGELNGSIIATAMAGYDGHRGAVYYLGVLPEYKNAGYGRQIMQSIETLLIERGCPKLNILVRTNNDIVIEFYKTLGYALDDVACFSKRLIPDEEGK